MSGNSLWWFNKYKPELAMTKPSPSDNNAQQVGYPRETERPPRKYGRWVYKISAVIAIFIVAHSCGGTFFPAELQRVDTVLGVAVNALRLIGIRNIEPGLSGPLYRQFYVINNGICIWGVVISSILTVGFAAQGILPIQRPAKILDALMSTNSWTASRAWLAVKLRTMAVAVVSLCFLFPLFLNGMFGWVVFQVHATDWLLTSAFTLLLFYLPGALLAPMILIVVTLPFISDEFARQRLIEK